MNLFTFSPHLASQLSESSIFPQQSLLRRQASALEEICNKKVTCSEQRNFAVSSRCNKFHLENALSKPEYKRDNKESYIQEKSALMQTMSKYPQFLDTSGDFNFNFCSLKYIYFFVNYFFRLKGKKHIPLIYLHQKGKRGSFIDLEIRFCVVSGRF